tara:strand:- start:610 stop:795 length:186 start_codon:yes stop_codon:yes gene_type:complete
MKDKIIKLLDDWKVNKHKQELMAEELLILSGVVKSLPCGDCENYAEYDGALKICSNCGTSL